VDDACGLGRLIGIGPGRPASISFVNADKSLIQADLDGAGKVIG
jgi:hypothetical protein